MRDRAYRQSVELRNPDTIPLLRCLENEKAIVPSEIANQDSSLRPEITGYAHIETDQIRIYQKVGHELNKLLNIGKYLPWLSQ